VAGAGPGSGTVVPATQKDATSSRGLWAVPKGDSLVALPDPGRSYRGTMEAAGAGKGLHMTDIVDVEQYLRGLGEVPASWPAAALQAQAIAARTFAVRAAAAGRTLCDDQQCQVYIGAGNEYPSTTAAATATRGQVLTYQGGLAETVYSASAGGTTATAEEGFGPGSPDLPYLKPVQYAVADPQLWATTMPLQQVAARFGYRGDVTEVKVTRTGPSGRPLEIGFEGSNGPMAVDGHRFWAELQLRSTLFTLRTEADAPVVDGVPLATRLNDDGTPVVGDDPVIATVGPAKVAGALGRAPWVGLAVLLLAVWATMANRMRPVGEAGAALAGDGAGPRATVDAADPPAADDPVTTGAEAATPDG
jgi:SpoIID/LytB domain protein